MRRIDEILEADAVNARAAIEILGTFDPALLEVIENVGELFEQFNDCAGESFSVLDQQDDQQLTAIAESLSVPPEELIRRIGTGEAGLDQARALWQSMRVRETKKFVLLLLYRYFRWGLTNMLHLRVSPVLGYGRLQAEAAALLRLFLDEPARGEEWLQTALTERGGKAFYTATQSKIRALLKQHGMEKEYERGSAGYQHVRMNAAARALSLTGEGARLADQEFEAQRPGGYYRIVLWFLSVQVKAFAALLTAVPEVRCDGWRDRVDAFARRIDAFWRVLEQRYPLEDTPE